MKLLVTIGLRLLGLALVVYILAFQVDYLDHLTTADGGRLAGRVRVSGDEAGFVPRGGGATVALGPEWRNRSDLALGLFTIVSESRKWLLFLSIFVYGPITLISIYRWWYLLREVEVPVTFREAFRLTFIGFFFSSAMPGMTGGDLVKGFYIARQAREARVRAFMSVLVDRVIGIFALGILAAAVLLPSLGDPRFRVPATIVYVFLAASVVMGSVVLSRRLRRLLRFDSLLARLPFARAMVEIDRAIVIYRDHRRAVGISILVSLVNHVTLVAMAVGIGTAVGIRMPVVQYFILYPVCLMMASIPLLPGGWGVREASFQAFFGMAGVPATQAVALSILVGISMLLWSLLGGALFLLSPDRVSRRELTTFHEAVDREIEARP